MYWPLAPAGFGPDNSFHDRTRLAVSFSGSKLALPSSHMDDGLFVQLELDAAFARIADDAGKVGGTHGAGFGLGIRPLRPSTLPSLPPWPIMSGVAIAVSKSSEAVFNLFDKIIGADVVGPGGLGDFFGLALSENGTLTCLPRP